MHAPVMFFTNQSCVLTNLNIIWHVELYFHFYKDFNLMSSLIFFSKIQAK